MVPQTSMYPVPTAHNNGVFDMVEKMELDHKDVLLPEVDLIVPNLPCIMQLIL